MAAAGPSGRGEAQQYHQQPSSSLGDAATRVLFSCCKGETHTHRVGFKHLYRRLRSMYRPEKLDSADDLCLEVLLGPASSGLGGGGHSGGGPQASSTCASILVLGCPTQPFSAAEFDTLRAFLRGGGSLLVALAEGGEAAAGTNLNYLLEELGIAANADAVVRTAHYKYLHPKEALISDGVLNRALLHGNSSSSSSNARDASASRRHAAAELTDDGLTPDIAASGSGGDSSSSANNGKGLDFVYPYGCTLSVQAPSVPILSSGKISYPMQRPLGE
jgi:intraflagellar transport protein 52